MIANDGVPAFQAAVTGGQYVFADGLFYGGSRPAWSNACLRAVLRGQASTRTRLGWIDLHTGLGPRGHGEKIWAGPRRSGRHRPRPRVVGRRADLGLRGLGERGAGHRTRSATPPMPSARAPKLTPMVLEYGTYSLEHTLQMLRAEHWLHQHPEAPPAQRATIKRALRDAFYIDADDWKTMVFVQAQAACLQAVAALAPATVR